MNEIYKITYTYVDVRLFYVNACVHVIYQCIINIHTSTTPNVVSVVQKYLLNFTVNVTTDSKLFLTLKAFAGKPKFGLFQNFRNYNSTNPREYHYI